MTQPHYPRVPPVLKKHQNPNSFKYLVLYPFPIKFPKVQNILNPIPDSPDYVETQFKSPPSGLEIKKDKPKEEKEEENENEETSKENGTKDETAGDAEDTSKISEDEDEETTNDIAEDEKKENKDDDEKMEETEIEEDKVDDKQPKPRALHKTTSIFLRNLAPTITKQEVEAMCKRYPGFLRAAIADPQPERRWFRRGWITFERDVKIKEICYSLNNIRLR